MKRPGNTATPASLQSPGKTYLTYQELSALTGYEVQTLRNFVTKGIFKLGKHYFKPNGRVLFYWPTIEKWIRGE
jgi:hypothetical protein